MSLAAYATRRPLRRAPSGPSFACSEHPVPARESPGQRGCLRSSQCTRTGLTNRRRPFRGPASDDPTVPGSRSRHPVAAALARRRALEQLLLARSATGSPSRLRRPRPCTRRREPSAPRVRRRARRRRSRATPPTSVANASGAGSPSSRPTRRDRVAQRHRLVGALDGCGSSASPLSTRPACRCAARDRAPRRRERRPRSSAGSGPAGRLRTRALARRASSSLNTSSRSNTGGRAGELVHDLVAGEAQREREACAARPATPGCARRDRRSSASSRRGADRRA